MKQAFSFGVHWTLISPDNSPDTYLLLKILWNKDSSLISTVQQKAMANSQENLSQKKLSFANLINPILLTRRRGRAWTTLSNEQHPFIVYYLNYCSLFLLSPYWIKWDSKNFEYIAVSNRPRKMMCGLVLLAQAIWEAWELYWSSKMWNLRTAGGNIVSAFDVATQLFFVPIIWQLQFCFWFRFQKVVKWINELHELGSSMSTVKVRFFKKS